MLRKTWITGLAALLGGAATLQAQTLVPAAGQTSPPPRVISDMPQTTRIYYQAPPASAPIESASLVTTSASKPARRSAASRSERRRGR